MRKLEEIRDETRSIISARRRRSPSPSAGLLYPDRANKHPWYVKFCVTRRREPVELSLAANSGSVLGEVHRTAAGRERDGEAMPSQLRDCRVLEPSTASELASNLDVPLTRFRSDLRRDLRPLRRAHGSLVEVADKTIEQARIGASL